MFIYQKIILFLVLLILLKVFVFQFTITQSYILCDNYICVLTPQKLYSDENLFSQPNNRCSINMPFLFYLYELDNISNDLAQSYYKEMNQSIYRTGDAGLACAFVYIATNKNYALNSSLWGKYKADHLIIKLDKHYTKYDDNAMVVDSDFESRTFRDSHDLSVYLNVPPYNATLWMGYSKIVETTSRQILFYLVAYLPLYNPFDRETILKLQTACTNSTNCKIRIINSINEMNTYLSAVNIENRKSILGNSTFTIILPRQMYYQQQFFEALSYGSIPVLVSMLDPLPFQEFIRWEFATINIPAHNLIDIHTILSQISLLEVLELKRKGRFYLESYLGNVKTLSRSILSAIRYRKNMLPSKNEVFSNHKILLKIPTNNTSDAIDVRLSNGNISIMEKFINWNFDPTHLESGYISPLKPNFRTSDAKDILQQLNAQNWLGGNYPDEKYTIIILAYKRDDQLKSAIERLNHLDFLDRAIIVWNDVARSPPPLEWWTPIHVEVFFINGTKNSLSNRFIPFKEIRTEAVFSMDDDYDVTNDNLMSLFKVWRENRDLLVGPYFRHGVYYAGGLKRHEYNLVLTGAAFLHKSYLYSYTYLMPEVIREKIDELINCEDIAMNFMISHLTRKHPLKATQMRDARGPKIKGSLHNRGSHYNKRAVCIKFFVDVYGYNPLISTEFRIEAAYKPPHK